MRRLATQHTGRTGQPKGAAMLFFLLIAVPVFLFGTAVAIDISNLIVTYNANINIAEAAAEAGATARDTNTGQLDAGEATRRANDLCNRMGVGNCASVNGPEVYAAVRMVPFPLYSNWMNLPNGQQIFNMDWNGYTATRRASVCNSYTPTGSSDLYCVRPDGN